MKAPGVALFVQTGSGPAASGQLHIGFAKDSGVCGEDVSGDYTMMQIGLGLTESFGVYRSDANFLNIAHADFGFDTPDMNTTTQTVAYRTGTPTTLFNNDGCTDGVRTRSAGGTTVRSMMTASGLFVLDLPAGQGASSPSRSAMPPPWPTSPTPPSAAFHSPTTAPLKRSEPHIDGSTVDTVECGTATKYSMRTSMAGKLGAS